MRASSSMTRLSLPVMRVIMVRVPLTPQPPLPPGERGRQGVRGFAFGLLSSVWLPLSPWWERGLGGEGAKASPRQLLLGVAGVIVTQRDRQRVGHVVRLRQARQIQLPQHGELHLLLRRPSVPGDALLDRR